MEALCYSVLFADKVIREDNGKPAVIGIFNQLNFPSLPIQFGGPWFLFLGIANMHGSHTITANLVHDQTQAVVLPLSIEVQENQTQGRNKVFEAGLPLPPTNFPKPGLYVLTVNIDGVQVASRSLFVNLLQNQAGPSLN